MRRYGMLLGALMQLVYEVTHDGALHPFQSQFVALEICISAGTDRITLAATTSLPKANCPLCRKPSRRVHSRYIKTLTDLPWRGVPVRIRLRLRGFFCNERSCNRTIFAEQLPLGPSLATHAAQR